MRGSREANRGSGRRAMGNETRLYKEAAAWPAVRGEPFVRLRTGLSNHERFHANLPFTLRQAEGERQFLDPYR
jgi:hypothetical protein